MFRKSSSAPQYDLYSSTGKMLSGKSLNLYEDDYGRHKLFFKQVTGRIDESIFKPLFTSSTGSPHAPIRIMIAMMVLKEAQGYSDAKLFEDCRFTILTRSALGL
ncbi:MAG: transposase, partial [Bacteroidota bacterium]